MKKTIIFDVDDVLVNFLEPFAKALHEVTGKNVPWDTWTQYSPWPSKKADDKFFDINDDKAKEIFFDYKILETCCLHEGVKQVLNSLHEKGYEINFITARGWHPMGKEITQKMISDNGLPVNEVVLTNPGQKKTEMLSHFKDREVVGFIDDSASHVKDMREAGINAYILNRSWNKNADFPRVANLQEFDELFPNLSPSKKPKI